MFTHTGDRSSTWSPHPSSSRGDDDHDGRLPRSLASPAVNDKMAESDALGSVLDRGVARQDI